MDYSMKLNKKLPSSTFILHIHPRTRSIFKQASLNTTAYHFDILAVSSLTSLAATMAVIPSTVSRWGLSSTTSAATISPWRRCRMLRTSRNERPPGSMWDTPGAKAGSRQSTSIEMYTPLTPSPNFYKAQIWSLISKFVVVWIRNHKILRKQNKSLINWFTWFLFLKLVYLTYKLIGNLKKYQIYQN